MKKRSWIIIIAIALLFIGAPFIALLFMSGESSDNKSEQIADYGLNYEKISSKKISGQLELAPKGREISDLEGQEIKQYDFSAGTLKEDNVIDLAKYNLAISSYSLSPDNNFALLSAIDESGKSTLKLLNIKNERYESLPTNNFAGWWIDDSNFISSYYDPVKFEAKLFSYNTLLQEKELFSTKSVTLDDVSIKLLGVTENKKYLLFAIIGGRDEPVESYYTLRLADNLVTDLKNDYTQGKVFGNYLVLNNSGEVTIIDPATEKTYKQNLGVNLNKAVLDPNSLKIYYARENIVNENNLGDSFWSYDFKNKDKARLTGSATQKVSAGDLYLAEDGKILYFRNQNDNNIYSIILPTS